MRSRSPKSNQFFYMSQQYRCASLVKIYSFLQEIWCGQAIFQQSKPSCDLENGVCLFVLRFYGPVNPMGSCRARSVYLTTHLLGRLSPLKRLTSIVHILSPETDNCPSWISGRERMTVENISWSISTKECCRPRRGLNPRPPGLQSDGASNWATEAGLKMG